MDVAVLDYEVVVDNLCSDVHAEALGVCNLHDEQEGGNLHGPGEVLFYPCNVVDAFHDSLGACCSDQQVGDSTAYHPWGILADDDALVGEEGSDHASSRPHNKRFLHNEDVGDKEGNDHVSNREDEEVAVGALHRNDDNHPEEDIADGTCGGDHYRENQHRDLFSGMDDLVVELDQYL